jgi:nucleoside-triphosphatase THEP1
VNADGASSAGRVSSPESGSFFILTGAVHSGKTTFLRAVAAEARKRSTPVGGYLSPAAWDQGQRIGYDLLTLPDEKLIPFMRMDSRADSERIGPYHLIPETLGLAQDIIRSATSKPLVIVDEVGPLELAGGGVWSALEESLRRPPRKLVLTIRDPLVQAFLARIPREPTDIVRADSPSAVQRLLG